DTEAWQRLWAHSRLVLHTGAQALTCSLSSPCDLPAELIPCWQPAPTGPCQALPGLRHSAMGQGSQELGGLQPHPNLCVQVWSHGQVRLSQCLRDPPGTPAGALPGRPDDILLLQRHGNTSMCVLERGACTPLASFTSTVSAGTPCPGGSGTVAQPAHPMLLLQGWGQPGLLEQELRRDVVMGQCRQVSAGSSRDMSPVCDVSPVCDMSLRPQIWHHENSTRVTLWACPMHKYLRARWVLAWMGVLLGAACLLLVLLLKKEHIKGEWCPWGGCSQPGD
ncbi:I17RC protein, partial [Eolophus roseicapillus]|nr:I17RC protein [Eolophus roseicapilla]